ncbi:uncharacterized protein M421DRAFT_145102 [Didymella exigua CBS 183.55]|uniref:Uncharacterized protein n=1 Tax=Didymella exigua CBS 183.55 TaxID=1150837 RepID=A0A6A5RMM9_9PLEO|nr:uncharacterized protein M421DRAFT_145102 [Didymella exigua CBS 183.55]KAF1929042.1 hypothetical protein M421DRAFT_145102 [Didymella exigua CBS 183.55]
MVAFRVLVAAALACVVVAHDHPTDTVCVAPFTVTVTETVCGTPGVPVHTPPAAPSYEAPPPPPAPPVTSVESTATAPLSGPPVDTATVVPPSPPAETGVPPAETSVPPVGPPPVVPTTVVVPSTGVAPSTSVITSITSLGHSSAHSPTGGHTSTISASLRPSEVSTAGAVMAMPTAYLGFGSLFAAGAAAMAVIA